MIVLVLIGKKELTRTVLGESSGVDVSLSDYANDVLVRRVTRHDEDDQGQAYLSSCHDVLC